MCKQQIMVELLSAAEQASSSLEAMLKLVGGQGLLKQDQLPPSCDPCKDVRQPLYFTAPVVSACDVGLESG